jgi:LPS export ABC transporter protein LptC
MQYSSIYGKLQQFFVGLLLLGFLCSCENDERVIENWTKNKVMVEEARSVESFLSQDGRLKAKLSAPLMLRVMGDTLHTDFPESLHCIFYNDSAQAESWVDAKQGRYFESINKVYLWDSVVVINIGGDTLKAADLWWDQNTKLFYTDKYAEYRRKDRQIFPGKGLEATQDFSRVTFNYPTGFLKVKEEGFPQ